MSPFGTANEILYYIWGEAHPQVLEPHAGDIRRIIFTRLANGGGAFIEIEYEDHKEKLQHLFKKHSPDGFEFGYRGSGPAEAALNILALFISVKECTQNGLYQDFKRDFIAGISQETGGEISGPSIIEWIKRKWEEDSQ